MRSRVHLCSKVTEPMPDRHSWRIVWSCARFYDSDLLPWVSEFEADPLAPRKILGGYKRIIIIDSALQGLFDEGALSRWLLIEKDYDIGGVKVRIGSFKFGNTSEASHLDPAPFARAAETSR
jgi:hypothetical protein